MSAASGSRITCRFPGAHEKTIGALKSQLAFATVPTRHYGANSAWQQLVALAHNLITNFQIETGAPARHRSRKATALFPLQSIQTMRLEWIQCAGELVRPNGVAVLRLPANPHLKRRFERTAAALAHAA